MSCVFPEGRDMKPPNRELSWVYHPTGTRDRSQKKTQRSGEREREHLPSSLPGLQQRQGNVQRLMAGHRRPPHPMSKPGGLCALSPDPAAKSNAGIRPCGHCRYLSYKARQSRLMRMFTSFGSNPLSARPSPFR